MEAIPEDVMKAAATGFLAFSPSPTAFDGFNTALIVEAIARAIMAERERCARVADAHGGEEIGAAIRKP